MHELLTIHYIFKHELLTIHYTYMHELLQKKRQDTDFHNWIVTICNEIVKIRVAPQPISRLNRV